MFFKKERQQQTGYGLIVFAFLAFLYVNYKIHSNQSLLIKIPIVFRKSFKKTC